MPKKVALNIFKIGEEYRAVIQIGNNAQPVSMGITVYQSGMEANSNNIREVIRQLKDKAQQWARDNLIPFVDNLDFNPYD